MAAVLYSTENKAPEIPAPLRARADYLYYKKAQLIYQEGSTPLGAYFVENGSIKITKLGSSGKEQILKIVTNAELLCLSDLFSQSRYGNSAKTLEDSSLLFISKQDFWEVLKEDDQIFRSLLQQLALNIRKGNEKIVELAYKPVRGRLAEALLSLNSKFSTNGREPDQVAITRSDLASYIGTVKETVNRLLSEFRSEKLISTQGTRIKISDPNGLERISRMYV
ncbi:Crp/Fnr family transcriptional regulator [Salegentibacter flavus]|uniref:cAMP-binding domain of CRP or a regulatory subunit of cAMP-dependent protein kinases n=1 Tax=Salegentibacter flavus TaxID=287099 RepID=A0A1I5D072_9FLAO|nr:Crp/Fnr family transcriptional regulator [Salegentibacter flavus]SFN92650.1 cAMP-binding domain of CRP or a regulatory subunit of cAMP-dependent protein kinases [Salegentibacter flavus]